MKDKEKQIEFKVIDNNTGKEADIGKIALKEDWAKGLMYCDMQGFAILDDGNLILLDECGKFEYCPSERFSIMFEDSVVLSREEYERLKLELAIEKKRADESYTQKEVEEIIASKERIKSKEIAEEFYDKVNENICVFRLENKNQEFADGYARAIADICGRLDQVAKQFGVEIKE